MIKTEWLNRNNEIKKTTQRNRDAGSGKEHWVFSYVSSLFYLIIFPLFFLFPFSFRVCCVGSFFFLKRSRASFRSSHFIIFVVRYYFIVFCLCSFFFRYLARAATATAAVGAFKGKTTEKMAHKNRGSSKFRVITRCYVWRFQWISQIPERFCEFRRALFINFKGLSKQNPRKFRKIYWKSPKTHKTPRNFPEIPENLREPFFN